MILMTDLHQQASDSPLSLNAEEFDLRIKQRMTGENRFLDGTTFQSASTLSKAVRKSYVLFPSFKLHLSFFSLFFSGVMTMFTEACIKIL